MTPHRPARRTAARAAIAVLATSSLVLAACGDDDGASAGDAADEAAAAAEIEVSVAWARTSPAAADAGAVYLELTDTGELDDALVGAGVDTSVAGVTEIHETATVDDGGMDDDAMDDGAGMMEMRPVDRIEIPAGETVALEPGGYHVMLKELAAPLEAATTIEVTLTFEESGEQVVTADVRDAP